MGVGVNTMRTDASLEDGLKAVQELSLASLADELPPSRTQRVTLLLNRSVSKDAVPNDVILGDGVRHTLMA